MFGTLPQKFYRFEIESSNLFFIVPITYNLRTLSPKERERRITSYQRFIYFLSKITINTLHTYKHKSTHICTHQNNIYKLHKVCDKKNNFDTTLLAPQIDEWLHARLWFSFQADTYLGTYVLKYLMSKLFSFQNWNS